MNQILTWQKFSSASLWVLLLACGSGDGPAGGNGTQPVLGSCTRSRLNLVYKCTEYRNITAAAWQAMDCEDEGEYRAQFVDDTTCDNSRKVRGVCRKTDSGGMTTSEWFYDCGGESFADCAKQPSTIQAECQSSGGTYIPPDEAG